MSSLDLQSERYSATGNLASEGMLNQLGRPTLDRLAVLVRESVQNSWDARRPDATAVTFGISGWNADARQRTALRDTVFADAPPNLGLRELLASEQPILLLAVHDHGTTGLGGPTRADIDDADDPEATESRDFVDFLRNIGHPPDKALSGGTYGYGKAALYLASSVRTICVHTHCTNGGRSDRRFMGSALGPGYRGDGRRGYFTGRHWWGRLEEKVVEPIRGAEADRIAARLGMPEFAQDERGTTILIVQPHIDDRTPEQAMRLMATTLVWNFWPKMLPAGRGKPPAMNFEVSWQGQPIEIPDPRRFPPVSVFVRAMDKLKKHLRTKDETDGVFRISCERPRQDLGFVALETVGVQKRVETDAGDLEGLVPFEGRSHHVALMRQPELVVRYLPGPELPVGSVEYGGVFLADEEVDEVFAKAEPPTHDDWVHHSLEDRHWRTFVRVALRRVGDAMREFTMGPGLGSTTAGEIPLGVFSDRLGGLLPGREGPGAGVASLGTSGHGAGGAGGGRQSSGNGSSLGSGSGQRGGGGSSNAVVTIVGEAQLGVVDGAPALTLGFEVAHARGSNGTKVTVDAAAVLDGNELEREAPAGAQKPTVLRWADPQGKLKKGSPEIHVPRDQSGQWSVSVSVPAEVMVSVSLGGVPESGE